VLPLDDLHGHEGGVVGGFLIAMYLPIFSIAGAIK
jgi:type II secretory pathway component PulF